MVATQQRRPQIQVFDPEGRFQYAFGEHGTLSVSTSPEKQKHLPTVAVYSPQ